jgi:hypothetical protein
MTDATSPYDEAPVEITAEKPFRMSPEAMRALRKATGMSISDILQNEDDPETRFQAIIFGDMHRRLARLGHLPDAGELWDRAGKVDLEFSAAGAPDPFDGERSTTSPRSAVTGE